MNQSQSQSGKFLNDMLIYGVGALGSRLITFLLVPLYTFFVPVAEYGYYDLYLSVVLVLIGVVCLQMSDGVLKFLINAGNDHEERSRIITSISRTMLCNSSIVLAVALIVAMFTSVQCLWLIVALTIVMSAYEVQINVYRGLGNNKYFAVAGILTSVLLLLLSIVFVVWLRLSIEGIFLANIFARLITLVIIEARLKVLSRYISRDAFSGKLCREIIFFSLPLMVNGLCWWVIMSNNKFFISHYIGLAENGQYAVVLKFATLLQTVSTIFYKAWQENALQQYNSPDRDAFFSSIFNGFIYFLAAMVVVSCFAVKICYPWIVSAEYQQSIVYLYPLAFASMVYAASTFFDLGYQCAHRTSRSMPSIMLAGVVNLLCNFVLIKWWGTVGIVASSIISYFVLLAYRAIETRRYFKVHITTRSWLMLAMVIANGAAFYVSDSLLFNTLYLAAVLTVLLLFMPRVLRDKLMARLGRRA